MKYHSWNIISEYPSDLISEILKKRNIVDVEQFLESDYSSLSSSDKIHDLNKAVKIIKEAGEKSKKVGLFMDYDADGICGGAILYKGLKKARITPICYVPKRKDGYGLNRKSVDQFIKDKIELLITVDCGIRDLDEVKYASENGIDVVIIDHHQLGQALPQAKAIVHPLLSKNSFSDYSGGGVAFMLVKELYKNSGQEKWLLDLAAISSVGDVVPLIEDNRILVKYGSLVLNKTKNIGIKELCQVANIQNKLIGTYEIGFMLAPRINASGRMSDARDSFDLMITEDHDEAKKLATILNEHNVSRQNQLSVSQEEAFKYAIEKKLDKNNVLIVKGEFNEGIIGLIASKLVEKYFRPAIVFSTSGDFMKGSARSIPGIDITELISTSGDLLLGYGGHAQAAGLSISKEKFSKFEDNIIKSASNFKKETFKKVLAVDALIEPDSLNIDLAERIEKMKPFGIGNQKPILMLKNIKVDSIRSIGKNLTHRKIAFLINERIIEGLIFNFSNSFDEVKRGEELDIVFTAAINEFMGKRKLELMIEDVKKSE